MRTRARAPARFISTGLLWLLATALAAADDDQWIQQRIRETIKKITPTFVFIGGGSGVIVSPDGYMLTNHHVAGDADKRTVWLTDNRSFTAHRIGIDPSGDLVLLKIQSDKPLPYAEMGDSDKLEVGQYLIAVGNPHGLGNRSRQPSVSVGVLSAFHRSQNYHDAVQTDAAINPGNSGGPLFDLDGRVIAINGRMNSRFGHRVGSGVAYSIPINQAKRFIPRFIEAKDKDKGRVRHGTLPGLTLADGPADRPGAKITKVEAGSYAERAGLQPGDVIVGFEGLEIINKNRLENRMWTYPAGSKVGITVVRDGAEIGMELVLAEVIRPIIGVRPDPEAPAGKGAVIGEVIRGNPAAIAGMKKGDIVIEFNGVKVTKWDDLTREIQKGKPGDPFTVKIVRENKEMILKGKLGES